MGETPLHQFWIIRLLDQFRQRYLRQPQVYVASDLMVYFSEGKIDECFVPDLIVLLDSDQRERRVLKLWEERSSPNFVLEVTSKSTRGKDQGGNLDRYARLGIVEYFQFDPASVYLLPALQGYRLQPNGRYLPIVSDKRGQVVSEQLGIVFALNSDGGLELRDQASGELLLTEAETERQAKERERKAKESEQEATRRERFRKEQEQQAREEEYRRRLEAEAQLEAERTAKEHALARLPSGRVRVVQL